MLAETPKHWKAKTTAEGAREMRHLYATGQATIEQLARKAGMTYEGVRQILRRRCWKDAEQK